MLGTDLHFCPIYANYNLLMIEKLYNGNRNLCFLRCKKVKGGDLTT